MASSSLLQNTTTCIAKRSMTGTHQISPSNSTIVEESDADISSIEQSCDCDSEAFISGLIRTKISVSSQRQRRISRVTQRKLRKKNESGDGLLFEDAKSIVNELSVQMAALKNKIVDIGTPCGNDYEISKHSYTTKKQLASSKSAAQDGYRKAIDSCQIKKSENFGDNDKSPLKPNKTFDEKEKPESVSLAWEKMSLQNGIVLSTPFTDWPEMSSCHANLPDQLTPQYIGIKEETGDDVIDVTQSLENQGDLQEMSSSNSQSKTPDSAQMDQPLKAGSQALSNAELLCKAGKVSDASNNKLKEGSETSDKENEVSGNDMTESFISARSKTMPTLGRPKMAMQKVPSANEGERLTRAKELVERAIKFKKVFTIQGGYSTIRHSLRRRGWVEKFYKIPVPQKKPTQVKKQKGSDDDDNDFDDDVVDDDDDDDDVDIATQGDDQPKIPPWEEDDGIYGIMSRMVRNVTPSLFWVLKRDAIDYRYLTKDQMVNHYCKAGSFTTKVGLCVNMKNVVWFDNCDYDTFFPRCYRLSHDEERDAFIDDYRLTACMNIIKVALKQHTTYSRTAEDCSKQFQSCSSPDCSIVKRVSKAEKCVCILSADENTNKDVKISETTAEVPKDEDWQPAITQLAALKKKKKQRYVIPVQVLETAIYQCEKFLASKDHEDIDVPREVGQLTDQQWDDLIKWYYQLVQEEGTFSHIPLNLAKQCESLTRRLTNHCPQFEMDGTRNVWIVKPGAKSRGRGIMCYEKLEDMLKLVCTQVVKKDGKYVVQKYIERPLLIYNTKFDIRQWFLVTDWNPLTLWFYRDSYLRFCSQQFTLEDFDQSIHLSNNAIQKHYKNGPRSSRLPEENMWTHEEFKKYLASKKHPNVWDEKIYPQMKRAIICALLVTQDLVEYRKSSFELYGADFMLTEDFRPWLIEINSSPSMESSTSVTAKMCTAVLDDTIKVVVDRKFDGNCDIGRFELAYKQPLVTVPPYIGVSLCVEGQAVKKPSWAVRPNRESEPGRTNEPGSNETVFTPRAVTTKPSICERLLEHNRSLYTTYFGANAIPATLGNADASSVKKETGRISDSVSIKSVALQSTSVNKEVSVKSITSNLRAPGDTDKIRVNARTVVANFSQNNEPVIADQKALNSADETVKQIKREAKGTESKKSEVVKIALPDSGTSVSKTGGMASDVTVQSGSSLTNPNPPGSVQRRVATKATLSTNSTIQTVLGAERSNQPRTVTVTSVKPTDLQTFKPNPKGNTANSASSWNRACQWCGRGGNLHLDSADPNCRCQKDSVLISMHIGQANPRIQDLIVLNNQQLQVSKTQQGQNKTRRANKTGKNTVSSSTCPVDGNESPDSNSKTSTPVSCGTQDPATGRPDSVLSNSLNCSNTNVSSNKSRPHKMRKSVSVSSHPPDSILNPFCQIRQQLNEQIDLSNQQQCRSDSFSGIMQTLTPCQQNKLSSSRQLRSDLYHQHQQMNRGLLGGMFTTKVRNFLAKKDASSSSIIKLWPSMAYIETNRCQSPLSVIAQRQMTIKQQK